MFSFNTPINDFYVIFEKVAQGKDNAQRGWGEGEKRKRRRLSFREGWSGGDLCGCLLTVRSVAVPIFQHLHKRRNASRLSDRRLVLATHRLWWQRQGRA
jgi:hypothetical protein